MTPGSPLQGFCGLPDLRALGPSHFPLIVVKLGPAFQIEPVAVRPGPHAAAIACGDCRVQCPEPFDAEGAMSATARRLLIDAVQDAVRRFRFRMCIVWSPECCSYVETDRVDQSSSLPSGGVLTPHPVRFEVREALTIGTQRRDPRSLN